MCAFSVSFTTTVFSHRSIRWLGAPPRRVAPKGQSSSLAQHRIEDRLYHRLLSTFVAHRRSGITECCPGEPAPSDEPASTRAAPLSSLAVQFVCTRRWLVTVERELGTTGGSGARCRAGRA